MQTKRKQPLIKAENYITPEIGLLTLKDIIKELEKPGLDPRKSAKVFEFDANVKSIKDLKTGMILPGIVNNITNFGCFVDIGIKESGLVHISQLKAGFVSDVNEVVKLHQHVDVKVTEVDEDRKRIQLTMVFVKIPKNKFQIPKSGIINKKLPNYNCNLGVLFLSLFQNHFFSNTFKIIIGYFY